MGGRGEPYPLMRLRQFYRRRKVRRRDPKRTGSILEIVEDYRRRADEVERLADSAASEDHRRRIREIAQSWRVLADQREAMIKRLGVPQPPKAG